MKVALLIVQVLVSVILSLLILIQAKGVGLGSTFGGLGGFSTRRGVEKVIFNLTIIFAVLFFFSSLAQLLVS